jgi:signal transduction histidine kinase
MNIFYLNYQRSLPDGTPVGWQVGCYSSLKNAEEAKARLETRHGYRDFPAGLSVSCYCLDEEYDDPTLFGLWENRDSRPNLWLHHTVAAAVAAASMFAPPQRRIEIHSSPQGVSARVDPQELGTVVAHLVANGWEAVGDNGRVEVTVDYVHLAQPQPRAHPQLPGPIPPGWHARLIVSDDGCGMDAETRSRMFEPMFSTKAAGRGMGLARVYSIAGANGWWLDVQSTPGAGTEVKVFFPCEGGGVEGDSRRE